MNNTQSRTAMGTVSKGIAIPTGKRIENFSLTLPTSCRIGRYFSFDCTIDAVGNDKIGKIIPAGIAVSGISGNFFDFG